MDKPDRHAHELACLEAVRGQAIGNAILEKDQTEVHEIRLDGGYPETKLVVDLSRFGERDELDWKLWGEDFGQVPEGGLIPPEEVATQVMVQLYELSAYGPGALGGPESSG